MGVTYKLKDEVVQFIISQRQGNPLSSCRQLAESASQKFGLHLSKSSVHDVLKESGIVTPRGRKPKDKFAIPQEKKKQIQVSLSQVKLIAPIAPNEEAKETLSVIIPPAGPGVTLIADVVESKNILEEPPAEIIILSQKEDNEISAEYEGAGKIFLKAVLWDLGIFSEEGLRDTDWDYYLTYAKGVKVVLENSKDFFIDLPLPIERCIREVADGLINNVKPLIVHKISDEEVFRACMEAQSGFKMANISIVDQKDHILLELSDIMNIKRTFNVKNRTFVECKEKTVLGRLKTIFFSQVIEIDSFIDHTMNLQGFDSTNKGEIVVTILISDGYDDKNILLEAAEKLNGMYLRDEQDRLVNVKIQSVGPPSVRTEIKSEGKEINQPENIQEEDSE